MKTNKSNSKFKMYSLAVLTVMSMNFFYSCSHKVSFLNSSVVPAARGSVKVSRDNNKNYVVKIRIDNLAEVSRLQPPKNCYVVWMITDKEELRNIGQIKSAEAVLSSKLSAYYESVSSFKPIRIFITAENDAAATNPDPIIILTTSNF